MIFRSHLFSLQRQYFMPYSTSVLLLDFAIWFWICNMSKSRHLPPQHPIIDIQLRSSGASVPDLAGDPLCRTSKSCSYLCPVRSAVCPCSTRVAVQILAAGNFNVPRFPKLGPRFRQIAVDHYKNILAGMLHTSLSGAAIATRIGCRSAVAMPPPCRLFPIQKTMPLAVPRRLPRKSILL